MNNFDTSLVDELSAADEQIIDLDDAFLTLYNLHAAKNAAIGDLRNKVMELEKEMEAIADPYDNQITELQAKIADEIRVRGKAFKCQYGKASYRKEYERSSWDTKALTGYAAAHPEIEQFKKTTLVEASVTVSVGDLE